MENISEKRTQDQTSTAKKVKTDTKDDHNININDDYKASSFIQSLSEYFVEKKSHQFENGAKIVTDPFTCCILPNFLQPLKEVDKIKDDVDEIDVELKINDLYQFKQSEDLAGCLYAGVEALRKLFNGNCLEWMKDVTKIPLSDKVDMSCSCYTYTDHLLCHDDELEGRRIAYIYYLVPEWEEKDGGTLDLFKCENGQPTEIKTSFVPVWNNLVFFEVSPESYHQVSEVLSYKTRTSISGWFHGPSIKRPDPYKETVLFKKPSTVTVDIESWINHAYLDPETQIEIRDSFEESSEIELMTFIQEDKYEEICKALSSQQIEWKHQGPCNRRKYDEVSNIEQSPILKELENLFCSEDFLLLLSHITGLRLCPTEAEDQFEMSEVSSSVRRWNHGCYTLLHDQSFTKTPTLNSTFYMNFEKWDSLHGGYTSYVAEEEKDELLRVDPKSNSLALVYITEGTAGFVKYINKQSTLESDSCFYDLFCLYKER
ncbi:prolyl 3-hydroxylase OGFOD1 [Parasteatoda tepidariorum]|nr:prolyl 3-hydroxylase OGFOD1 [Parasteatoda tepidariorum]